MNKILVFLAAICPFFFACSENPQQRGDQSVTPITQQNMKQRQLRDNHEKMMGELGFVGGAYDEFEGVKMAFAFSGATSEDDLAVAKYGIERMKGYLSGKPETVVLQEFKPLATPLKGVLPL